LTDKNNILSNAFLDNFPSHYVCSKCGKKYPVNKMPPKKPTEKINILPDFPASQSELYSGLDYHIPICNTCVVKLFNHYVDIYDGNELKAVKRLCQLFDMYYDEGLFKAACKTSKKNSLISSYISKNNMRQYKGKTYDTTLSIHGDDDTINSIDDVDKNGNISRTTVKFFGIGLPEEDYVFLQEQYDDWVARHECQTKVQEELFKTLSFKQLERLKATRTGESTKDIDKSFQDILGTGNLQPRQNATDALSESHSLGTLIQKWETERPLPEVDEELKDVDKVGLYIDVFFKGHTSIMVGVKNAFSNLYTKFMKKYTVEEPKYTEDENNEVLFDAIFGSDSNMKD